MGESESKIGRFTKHESKAKLVSRGPDSHTRRAQSVHMWVWPARDLSKIGIVKEYRTELETALEGDRAIFLFLEQEGYNIPDDSNPKSIIFPQEKDELVIAIKRNYPVAKWFWGNIFTPPLRAMQKHSCSNPATPLVALQHPALLSETMSDQLGSVEDLFAL